MENISMGKKQTEIFRIALNKWLSDNVDGARDARVLSRIAGCGVNDHVIRMFSSGRTENITLANFITLSRAIGYTIDSK